MKFSIFLMILFVGTCTSQKSNAVDDSKSPAQMLTYVTGDDFSNMDEAETLIIKDYKELRKLFSLINRTRKPGLPVPDIDFSKEMVIVSCSGATSDGVATDINVIEVTDTEIVIGVEKNKVASNSSAVITPFSLYRLANTTKKIVVRN